MEKARLRLRVNGEDREVLAPVHHTLLEVLREELGLTGTKHGCELGECGTCLVLLDGRPVLSCVTLPVECEGREVKTVEGMARGAQLHPLQQAFAELGAANWITRWYDPKGSATSDEIGNAFADFLLRGLRRSK